MSALQFTLRPAGDADEPFLYSLYEATHGQHFALLPLAPAQRDALVRMQFNAQRASYRQQYPESQDFLILVGDEIAGRLWLDEAEREVRVLDIAIVPKHQGRGIGRAVLEARIEKAAGANQTMCLSVDRMNARAFELYRRLGFEVCGGNEVYLEMKRQWAK